ncbi:MAG: DUF5989 family protein [Verrucomicrobiota bacterium JB024]|jgi:hypothetical protein|nr:DUF5989 family protein [Verrucomicrobiota bacterium JB024]
MARRKSLISELFAFVREHKAYWIAPIILLLLLVGVLVLISSSKAAPFIYTLF